jgi:hypothetical protein
MPYNRVKVDKVEWSDSPVTIPGIARDRYNTETGFQVYCADWLRKRFEMTGNEGYKWFHHSANERHGARAGMTAKLMGQAKGFPDFVSPQLKLAVELKLPGRKASVDQIKWLDHYESIGWHAEVLYSFEQFRELVEYQIRKHAV